MGSCSSGQNLESLSADVYEVPGEPAVVIKGVPDFPNNSLVVYRYNTDSGDMNSDPFFGELLEGREIRKMFGRKYYLGKVVKYDHEMNWYRVVYEDNDFEDLAWRELEDVLLPLDISVPIVNLALARFKYDMPLYNSGAKINKSHHVKSVRSKGLSVLNDFTMERRSLRLLNLENSNVTQGSASLPKLEIRRSLRLQEKNTLETFPSLDGSVKEIVLYSNAEPKKYEESGRKRRNTSSVEDVNAKWLSDDVTEVVVGTDCSGYLLEQERNNQSQGIIALQKLESGATYSKPKEEHSGLEIHQSKDAKANESIVESKEGS